MRMTSNTLVHAAAIALAALTVTAAAQQRSSFDAQKFFEDIASRGVKAPPGFDGQKFFDEIASRGYSETNKLDGQRLFEELSSRGFIMPNGFDGRKYWEDQLKSTGPNLPPIVNVNK